MATPLSDTRSTTGTDPPTTKCQVEFWGSVETEQVKSGSDERLSTSDLQEHKTGISDDRRREGIEELVTGFRLYWEQVIR